MLDTLPAVSGAESSNKIQEKYQRKLDFIAVWFYISSKFRLFVVFSMDVSVLETCKNLKQKET